MLQILIIIIQKASLSVQLSNKLKPIAQLISFIFHFSADFHFQFFELIPKLQCQLSLMLSIILCADVKLPRYSCTSTTIYHMVYAAFASVISSNFTRDFC